ncbi:PglZ domain-containing protein, partial [Escherichia coli]
RGDNKTTENEVFFAANESIQEIIKLVQKLTMDRTITSYFITADHGFIYKRDKLDESDKLPLKKRSDILLNKRFILSKERLSTDGALCYSME